MIFNKLGRLINKDNFFIDKKRIVIANEYKYLGLLFKPSGSFSHAVINLMARAKKAMFSLRSSLASDRLYVIPHLKLFDSCIKPIALYCSEVWIMDMLKIEKGNLENRYNSLTPEKIHVKYLKNILGLNRGAVNSAVLSELGRYPLSIASLKMMIGFWLHVINSNGDSLINTAYHSNMNIKKGFCQQLETLLKDIGFYHIWENQNTFSKRGLIKCVGNKLQERYIRHWQRVLDETSDIFCSKLRTYKDIKDTYNIEKYLLLDIDKSQVQNYLRIRISNSKLMIEQGRHKNLKVNKRLCPTCQSDVETEIHFIMSCPSYKEEREKLFESICHVIPSFITMNVQSKFKFIMQSNEYDISMICVKAISNMYNNRLMNTCKSI